MKFPRRGQGLSSAPATAGRAASPSGARNISSSAAPTAATAAAAAMCGSKRGRPQHADRLPLPAAFQGQDRHARHGPQPHRRQGRDITLKVPVGTQIFEEDNETLICRPDRGRPALPARQGRQWRLRQRPFQVLHQSGAAPRQSRPGGRGKNHLAAAQADRRCRPGRPAQRRQVDLPGGHQRPSRRSPTIPSPRCIPISASLA
jgi:hypothetical protein